MNVIKQGCVYSNMYKLLYIDEARYKVPFYIGHEWVNHVHASMTMNYERVNELDYAFISWHIYIYIYAYVCVCSTEWDLRWGTLPMSPYIKSVCLLIMCHSRIPYYSLFGLILDYNYFSYMCDYFTNVHSWHLMYFMIRCCALLWLLMSLNWLCYHVLFTILHLHTLYILHTNAYFTYMISPCRDRLLFPSSPKLDPCGLMI